MTIRTAAKPRLKNIMSRRPKPTRPRLIAEKSITSAVGHGTIPPASPRETRQLVVRGLLSSDHARTSWRLWSCPGL